MISNLIIRMIPAISTLGFMLPGIFVANHAERLPLKLPFYMKLTLGERLPTLLIALVALVVIVFRTRDSRARAVRAERGELLAG